MCSTSRQESREMVVAALLELLDRVLPPEESVPLRNFETLDLLNHIKEYRPTAVAPPEDEANVRLGID